MLKIETSSGNNLVTIGAAIRMPQFGSTPAMSVTWPCGLNSNDLRAGCFFDPVLKGEWAGPVDGGCILIPVIDVDLDELYSGGEVKRHKFGGYKPQTVKHFDYLGDQKTYGTAVGNLYLRLHGDPIPKDFGKSKDTSHLSYRGHATRRSVVTDELRFLHTTTFLGQDLTLSTTERLWHDLIVGYNVFDGERSPHLETFCHWTQFRTLSTFNQLRKERDIAFAYESWYGQFRYRVYGFDYSLIHDGDGVTLTFKYQLECFTSLINGRACPPIGTLHDRSVFDVVRTFRVNAKTFPGHRDNDYFPLPVELDLSVHSSYSLVMRDNQLGFDDPNVFHFGGVGDDNYVLDPRPFVFSHCTPYKANNGLELLHSDSVGHDGSNPNRLLDSFGRHVDRHHGDYVELAAFSANDALSDFSTDFNPYETLQGLKDLPALLEKPNKWAHLLKRGGKLGGKNSLDFVDQIANEILTYKYVLAPASSEVAGAKESAKTIYSTLTGNLPKLPDVLYGKHHIEELPHAFKFPGGEKAPVQLTVRTKMTLSYDQPTLLLWLIAANKSGFLPTTSRIFALVRYSFVVDWFTNLSQRFQFWDETGIRALLRVGFYEHSYLYKVAVPEKTLWRYGLKSDDFELRYYMRRRSLFHPVWSGRSKYDPLDRTSIDLLAGGSLIWLRK